MSGAFNSFPRKFGREQGHVEELLLNALLEGDGSAMASEVDSYNWAEQLANAHAIAALYHLNQRFANQWDPVRMTDFIPRWERILHLTPLLTDSDTDRRTRIGAKMALYAQPPTQQVITDMMTTLLGPLFVQIVNTPSSEANAFVGETAANQAYGYAGGGVSVPGGVTLPDATALGITWYSSVAYICILTQRTATSTDASYYAQMGTIVQFLDDILPAWATWAWVEDGTTVGEFILDDVHNLDNERMGS